MIQAGKESALRLKPQGGLRIHAALGRQQFYGDPFPQLAVPGFVNRPHAAATGEPQDLIAFELRRQGLHGWRLPRYSGPPQGREPLAEQIARVQSVERGVVHVLFLPQQTEFVQQNVIPAAFLRGLALDWW